MSILDWMNLHELPIFILVSLVLAPVLVIIICRDRRRTDHPLMCQICFKREPTQLYKGLPMCDECFKGEPQ
jgi:hypothetical protein